MKITPKELQPLAIFENLSEQLLEWICEHGTKIELAQNFHRKNLSEITNLHNNYNRFNKA
jgi:hypothetical protein